MYGLQQSMKTNMMTKVILTVLTLALGMRPREEARRLSAEAAAAEAVEATAHAPSWPLGPRRRLLVPLRRREDTPRRTLAAAGRRLKMHFLKKKIFLF